MYYCVQKTHYGNCSDTAENCIIFTTGRPITCMKWDGTAPVAIELFTVEMTLGPTISRNPPEEACGDNVRRQVVDFM